MIDDRFSKMSEEDELPQRNRTGIKTRCTASVSWTRPLRR